MCLLITSCVLRCCFLQRHYNQTCLISQRFVLSNYPLCPEETFDQWPACMCTQYKYLQTKITLHVCSNCGTSEENVQLIKRLAMDFVADNYTNGTRYTYIYNV